MISTTKFLVVTILSFSLTAFAHDGIDMSSEDAPVLPAAEAPAAQPVPVNQSATKPTVKREVAKEKKVKKSKKNKHKKMHAKRSGKQKTKRM